MQVTPVRKSFGSYKPGDPFELPEKAALHLIKAGLVQAVDQVPKAKRAYRRRDMRAED